MIGYCMRNDEGEYLSMNGGSTASWFEASKFDRSGIESRKMYLECGYKVFKFDIQESEAAPNICGNYCSNTMKVNLDNEGIYMSCDYCGEKSYLSKV